ncbi:tRNA 4-thiouridine(8) synthase ThiI [Candidatus Omnitrophota bacterium]
MKAVGLISGGLDSALAVKVIGLQGIEVIGLAFESPFMHPRIKELAQNLGIQISVFDVSEEHLGLIRNPSFGFGRNMNPCIDCHIFMLKKAKAFMLKQGADFIIAGDVLGQRPMSQNKAALKKIEEESGLEGLLLRPLSARLLPISIPEQKGWVKREGLFDFSGRSRKPQLDLAERLGLAGFTQPAGGCLLTDPAFSKRLSDLVAHQQEFDLDDIGLLKLGRQFRISSQAKLVLGRNQKENQGLTGYLRKGDFLLEPIATPGPTGLLRAKVASQDLLELSAEILAYYCDENGLRFDISIKNGESSQVVRCPALEKEKIERLRL